MLDGSAIDTSLFTFDASTDPTVATFETFTMDSEKIGVYDLVLVAKFSGAGYNSYQEGFTVEVLDPICPLCGQASTDVVDNSEESEGPEEIESEEVEPEEIESESTPVEEESSSEVASQESQDNTDSAPVATP